MFLQMGSKRPGAHGGTGTGSPVTDRSSISWVET
jgi:hypothetical protein